MEVPTPAVGARDFQRRQFSLRSLFNLTFIVAMILSIGVLCRGSEYFGALASLWTALSLLPIAAVWAMHRWRFATRRGLVIVSIACYFIALGLPAMQWADEIVFGWLAWLQSFWGCSLFFGGRDISGAWLFGRLDITIPLIIPIACAFGAAANVAYLAAIAAHWIAGKKPLARKLACRFAAIAAALSTIVVVPLGFTGDIVAFYPGYGLWAASLLAIALGTRP